MVLSGLMLAAAAPPPPSNGQVFDRVWSEVGRLYWDKALHGVDWAAARDRYRPQALAATDAEALYAAINHMLDLLHDSHVFALPPAEARYEAARDAGSAEPSFGFASWLDGRDWQVYAVTPGSAAERAGVRPGWQLRSVGGKPVEVDRHPVAGQRATLVFADLAGRLHPIDLSAMPEPPEPTVRSRRLPGDILWITLDSFDGHEDRAVAKALRAEPPPTAVILDLRDNDGGEEETAAKIGGLFFAERHTLLRRIDRGHEEKVPIEGEGRRSYAGPLAVLVGPRSASAAEAVAATLSESGRATSIGERTAGALTGATLDDLPDGGQLSIAQFDVRTPGGERIEGRGFTPAHIVPTTPAEMAAGQDPVLAAAVRLLSSGDGAEPARLSLSAHDTLHARP